MSWDNYGRSLETAMLGIVGGYQGSVEDFYALGETHTEHLIDALEYVSHEPTNYDATVLEYGCGIGRMSWALSDRFRHVVAVERSPAMLRLMTRHCPIYHKRYNLDVVLGSNMTDSHVWGRGLYGYVFSYTVFQHMPYRTVWHRFDEAHDILEPDGILHTQFLHGPRSSEQDHNEISCRLWDMSMMEDYLEWSNKEWEVLNAVGLVEGTGEHWLTLRRL